MGFYLKIGGSVYWDSCYIFRTSPRFFYFTWEVRGDCSWWFIFCCCMKILLNLMKIVGELESRWGKHKMYQGCGDEVTTVGIHLAAPSFTKLRLVLMISSPFLFFYGSLIERRLLSWTRLKAKILTLFRMGALVVSKVRGML